MNEIYRKVGRNSEAFLSHSISFEYKHDAELWRWEQRGKAK